MQIPADVKYIIDRLQNAGYEAFAVGGCVRDTLLGRKPGDWDITTSARPDQVKLVFGRTIDTGIQHGTVTVMRNHVGYEITTYRIDGEYEDGRHPMSVEFTASLTEDLKRRDFTINAMAYSPDTGIVDEFNGKTDLEQKVIRCVGDPMERFTEDALRILRAIRFSAQLGFSIEDATIKAVKKIAPNLKKVSKERIQVELTKLLCSAYPDRISLVFENGIAPYISSEFSQILWGKVCGTLDRLDLPAEKHLRWAAFLREGTEQQASVILKDLKMDNDTIHRVKTLVHWIKVVIPKDKTEIRRVMSQIEPELYDDLLKLQYTVLISGNTDPSEQVISEKEQLKAVMNLSREIRAAGDCVSLKQLAVTGSDLIASGMQPGKEIGAVLSHFLELVLENPECNTKEYLMRLL